MAAVELTVFHVILFFWSLHTAESHVMVMTWSGCESTCGGIEIPYPFGMTKECFLDERFKIHCNSSSGYPTLKVNGTDLVVTYISVYSSTIYVKPIVFTNCEGKDRNTVVDLEGSPFVFSPENYFVASGCNNLALMIQHNSAIGGCVSMCDEKRDLLIAGCSGINCCQTRIPSDLKVFNVTMKGVDGRDGSGGEKQCKYAFLADRSWIGYGRYYYHGGDPSDMIDEESVGAVLDWGIDRRVFESLVNNRSFFNSTYTSTCKDMNTSINSTIPIVQCYCNPGFEGNPYLYGYCQEDTSYRSYRRKIKAKMAGLGVGVGFGALFLLIGLWWLYKVFKRKRGEKLQKKYFKRNGGLLLQEQLSSGEVNVEKIKMFPSKELDKATDHYNANRTLGQGGQGTVYKGMLADGKIVAVKKSKVIDEGNLRQFINEFLMTLMRNPFNWEIRLRIAAERLHRHFHRDIKSTKYCLMRVRAKVADFGHQVSKRRQTHVTTLVQELWYLDPKGNIVHKIRRTGQKFSDVFPNDHGETAVDILIHSLARSCLRLNGKERPTMKEVTMVFERIQKSENLIVQREIEYERKEVMGAPWDATSTSTISSFGISASSSLDEKPLLHTY
uniref:Protein kinase domain-containing protein n=1 Tax=Salix viminalis TaxID=40686 RepID=A0A6N2MR70_SALVM